MCHIVVRTKCREEHPGQKSSGSERYKGEERRTDLGLSKQNLLSQEGHARQEASQTAFLAIHLRQVQQYPQVKEFDWDLFWL